MRIAPHLIGTALVVGALVIAPSAAYADESAPADPAASEVVAGDPAPSTDAATEPAETDPAATEPASADTGSTEPAETDPAAPDSAPPSEETEVPPAPTIVTAAEGVTPEEVLAESPEEPTITLFAEAAADAPAPGDPCYPAVCINNGTILLAVNPTGELNTSDGTGSLAGPGDVGLNFLPTNNDGTSPGCLCEGWGVADPATGVWGGANRAELGSGGYNVTVESFEYTASTAKSVVVLNDDAGAPYFRVTHEYVPSVTPNLYQVNVTIQNISGEPIATLQYRRVMDWDIEPTEFDEFVTIDTGTASAITYASDDGFASSNPLEGPSFIDFEGNAVDNGPEDHGALFDFTFPGLANGAARTFVIFYGAAATEAEAYAALAAVGAEAYSFGQTSTDPGRGTPNTFIFAFGNVGGAPLFPAPAVAPVVQPAAAPTVATLAVTGAADMSPVLIAGAFALLAGLALEGGTRLARRRV